MKTLKFTPELCALIVTGQKKSTWRLFDDKNLQVGDELSFINKISMVHDRIRSFNDMLIREYAEKDVWVISHHLTKLSFRASIERWSPEEFIRVDNEEKPVNCGVTIYGGNPKAGKDGKLELKHYNLKLY